MKYLVWAAILFGLYSGWCHLPFYTQPSHLESAVENILGALDHTSPDSAILDRTWKAIDSKGLYLKKQDIHVRRDQKQGERIVQVRFEIPVTVEWLGGTKTSSRTVEVAHSYPVNESEESSRLARIEDRKSFDRQQNRLARAHLDDYQQQVKRECAKGNTKYTYSTHVFVTFADGSTQSVPCSTAGNW